LDNGVPIDVEGNSPPFSFIPKQQHLVAWLAALLAKGTNPGNPAQCPIDGTWRTNTAQPCVCNDLHFTPIAEYRFDPKRTCTINGTRYDNDKPVI